ASQTARHNDVGEQQLDLGRARGPEVEGFLNGGGVPNAVALSFEDAAGEEPDGGIVFGEEDLFGAAAWRGFGSGEGGLGWRRGDGGKKDFEGSAGFRRTGNFDPTQVLFNDAIDGSQTKAGAFAEFFGGEEGLKDARQMFGRNAGAGIRDGQADEVSGAGFGMRAGV